MYFGLLFLPLSPNLTPGLSDLVRDMDDSGVATDPSDDDFGADALDKDLTKLRGRSSCVYLNEAGKELYSLDCGQDGWNLGYECHDIFHHSTL